MKRPTWHVVRRGQPGTLPAVEVAGPAIDTLIRHIVEQLATSIHDHDGRAAAWTDYVLAMSNQASAIEHGVEDVDMEQLDADADAAFDALMADLPRVVRLTLADARMLAGSFDEAAGRVGERAA